MDTTQRLRIAGEPVSRRPFAGLGVQADDVIYNDQHRQAGVTEADCEMVESRIRALRPGIVRIFVAIDVFNPTLDGRTYDWSARPYQDLLRHMRNLQRAGALDGELPRRPVPAR